MQHNRHLILAILLQFLSTAADAESWTSHTGDVFDLSRLDSLKLSARLPSIDGAWLSINAVGQASCGSKSAAVCIVVPGVDPTSAGERDKRSIEQLANGDLQVTFDGGEVCDVTRRPRKTLVTITCGERDEEAKVEAHEGRGQDVCVYRLALEHPAGCTLSSHPRLRSLSGCGTRHQSQEVKNCHGSDVIVLHGTSFAADAEYTVRVGSQDCQHTERLSDWELSCQLPPGLTGQDHDVEVSIKHAGVTQRLRLTQAVSYKVDLKAQFHSFEALGVGGLDKEVKEIYRRVFQSRSLPSADLAALGISHTKGILLYGPPGSGKTLIAKTVGKLLGTERVTLINTPSIMQKYLGESEKQLQAYFEPARRDHEQSGDNAEVHILIFDEIDAIFRERGIGDGSSASLAYDSVVNSLLTLMDGLKEQSNIVVFGMTNRPKLIDKALLRPGRFEVQIEIGAPDKEGRKSIFSIHTKSMRAANLLAGDVDLNALASMTSSFTGAEIAGVVRNAASLAIARHHDRPDSSKSSIRVEHADFTAAIAEMSQTHDAGLDRVRATYLPNGWLTPHPATTNALYEVMDMATVLYGGHAPQDTLGIIIKGAEGIGKTSFALHLLHQLDIEYTKMISPLDIVGLPEGEKLARLRGAFDEAYQASTAAILLDDLEGLIDYLQVGNQALFSQSIINAVRTFLNAKPPTSCRLLVLATLRNGPSRTLFEQLFTTSVQVRPLDRSGTLKLLSEALDALDGSPVLPADFTMSFRNLLRVKNKLELSSGLTLEDVEELLLAHEVDLSESDTSSTVMYALNGSVSS